MRQNLGRLHVGILLLAVALLVLFQSRRTSDPAPVDGASAAGSRAASSGSTSPNGFTGIPDWQRRYDRASAAERPALMEAGIAAARKRSETFMTLMREHPAMALAQALPMEDYAALPDEMRPYFERPLNGIGSVDLQWRTTLDEDGKRQCRHENLVYLDGRSWSALYTTPGPRHPQKDVPLSGIALGNLAVVAPSAVRPLTPDELPAASSLFAVANAGGPDPLTGEDTDGTTAALIGGEVHHFAAARNIAEVATGLQAAAMEAVRENRHEIAHEYEWLAASGGGDDDNHPVDATPFNDDVLDVLWIRVDFTDPGLSGDPVSQANLQTTLNTVNTNILNYSYNKANIVTTITPTYTMPRTGANYAVDAGNFMGVDTNGLDGDDDIHDDASFLADTNGYNTANYDVVAIFFPNLGGVSGSLIKYGGLASIGGSRHWINGFNSVEIILHEFGHNYGLYHANYRDPSMSLSGTYQVPGSLEYGDIFDTMGSGDSPESHFSHFAKNRLQWMTDNKVTEVTTTGTHRIYRFDDVNAISNSTLAVKVPMGGDVNYWIGYRQLYTSASYNLSNSAYIVAEGLSQAAETNLIDATPGSASPESEDQKDAGLEIGTPFVDSGVTFEAIGTGGTSPNEWIDVSVTFSSRVGLVADAFEFDELAGVAYVTLQRVFGSSGVVSVDYATSNGSATAGSDYYAASGTVTWADGDATDKRIAIAIRPDAVVEGTEDFTITLSNPAGGALDAQGTTATISLTEPGQRSAVFAPAFFNNLIDAIIPLPNGQVLVGGSISHTSGDFGSISDFARLNADGGVDTTLLTGSGFNNRVRVLALQADGKILASGDFTSYDGTSCPGFARLNSNGTIDSTFVTNVGTASSALIRSIAVQGDGKILVGGDFTSFNGTTVEGMVRLNTDGTADTPLALPFVTSWSTRVYVIVPQADGKIMVGGSFYGPQVASGARSGICRLNADGSRDASFDPDAGAHFLTSFTSLRHVYTLAALPNGQYLIGGSFTAYDEMAAPYMARINADGSFDSSFMPPAFDGPVDAIVAQPSGQIVATGSFSFPGDQLVRLTSAGAVESSFSIGTGTGGGPIYIIAGDLNGAIYVGGNFFSWNGVSSRPIVKLTGGVSLYQAWVEANFTPAQILAGDADSDADPDGDGFDNAAESGLGTAPLTANTTTGFSASGVGTVTVVNDGGSDYLQYSVDKGSVNAGIWFMAQFGGDLSTWSPTPVLPGPNAAYDVIEDSSTRFTARDKTPTSSNAERFVRGAFKQAD